MLKILPVCLCTVKKASSYFSGTLFQGIIDGDDIDILQAQNPFLHVVCTNRKEYLVN